jgi:hypothetical protein
MSDIAHTPPSSAPRFKIVIGTGATEVNGESWQWEEIEAECLTIKPFGNTQQTSLLPAAKPPVRVSLDQKDRQKEVKFAVVAAGIDTIRCATPTRNPKSPPISDICAALLASKVGPKNTGVIGFLVDESNPSYEHRIYLTEAVLSNQPFTPLKNLLTSLNTGQRLSKHGLFLTRRDRLNIAANLARNVLQLHGSWLKGHWKTEDIHVTYHSSDETPLLDSLSLSLPLSETASHPGHNNRDESSLIQNPILFPLGLALVELSLCQTLDDLRITADDDLVNTVANLKTASRNLPLVRSESGVTYAKVVKKCLYWSETEDADIESVEFQEAMFHSVTKPLVDDLRVCDGC